MVIPMGPAKNRTTLKVVELNSFFKTCRKLLEDDVDEFEKDVNFTRILTSEIKDKSDKY